MYSYRLAKITILFTSLIFVGCASTGNKNGIEIPTGVDETLIWSSSDERPTWTMEEPEIENDRLSFVGLSSTHATEKSARIDARRTAVNNIASYMGTLAKDKFQNAYLSYGLDSSIMDPTNSSRQFENQISANIVSRVKPKKWYIEKWDLKTGIGYRVFVLAKVPQEALDESFKSAANSLAKNAQHKAKEAVNKTAKKQAELAAEFWQQMESQGFVE